MYFGSYSNINNLGIVIAVSGAIRAGKSTLTSGLTHLYTFKIQDNLRSKMREIETILHEINFSELITKVNLLNLDLDNYQDNLVYIINSFVVKDSTNNSDLTHNLSVPFYDYLNYENKIDLLKEYIISYLHLQRQSYVFSNIRMYNHITSSYALEFKNEWIQLKNNKDFPLLQHSVIVEDDKLIYDSNISYMKKLHEDTGTDLFYRLYGHLFKEKSYYICTVQDVNRWIKQEREIAQTHIYVFKSTVVGNWPKLHKLLNVYEWIINFTYATLSKLYKNEQYFNKSNWFKRRFYKILLRRKKLFSKSFVYYETGIYNNIEKVGKEINLDKDKSAYNFDFVLPVPLVFGTIDTHEFNVVYDHLYARSNIKYSDLNEMEFNEEEILYMLNKDKDDKTPDTFISSKLDNDLTGLF